MHHHNHAALDSLTQLAQEYRETPPPSNEEIAAEFNRSKMRAKELALQSKLRPKNLS